MPYGFRTGITGVGAGARAGVTGRGGGLVERHYQDPYWGIDWGKPTPPEFDPLEDPGDIWKRDSKLWPSGPDELTVAVQRTVSGGVDELAWLLARGASNREIADKRDEINRDLLQIYYRGINVPKYRGADIAGGAPDVMNRLSSLVWAELGKRGEKVRQGVQKAAEAAYPEGADRREQYGGQYPWLTGAAAPTPDWAAIYEKARPKVGAPSMTEYFKGQFSPIHREYRAGVSPTEPTGVPGQPTVGGFEQFLGQYPFLEKYMAIPPRQRGVREARMRPPTRWLTY